MLTSSPTPATVTLITAVADFVFARVKLRCFAEAATVPEAGAAYRESCRDAALAWRDWRMNLDSLAAASLAELRAAAMVEPYGRPHAIAELLGAVDALDTVRIPSAHVHFHNGTRFVDDAEQDEPGVRQRQFLDSLRDYDVCDRRLNAAVAELQRLAALIPLPQAGIREVLCITEPRKQTKGKRGEERMIRHLQTNPESRHWTAKRWATFLSVSDGTVKGYQTWISLSALRKFERMQRQQSGAPKPRRRAK